MRTQVCFFLLFSQQVYTQDKETEFKINCNSDEFAISTFFIKYSTLVNNGNLLYRYRL